MSDATKLVLAGIGGYGRMYLGHLLDAAAHRNDFEIVGVADPMPQRCDRFDEVIERGIPVHSSLESFYRSDTADLAVVATPVHLHSAHIQLALAHGSHVLCEKPLASSMGDVKRLMNARDDANRHVAIGYQWSFCPAIRQLKRDIASGVFGTPLRMRTLCLWPRPEQYYLRNTWAGRVSDGNGQPVLDSPLHNACAHFVHNMFYVLGDSADRSASPSTVTAELYRANQIENYDTAIVRSTMRIGENNVEAIVVTSHAVPKRRGPVFCYEFADAIVSYDDSCEDVGIIARFNDGNIKRYGRPCLSNDPTKLWHTMDAVRTGQSPVCGIEASAGQTALVCAAQESAQQIHTFADDLLLSEDGPQGKLRWVRGLEDELRLCYDAMAMPSELDVPWGKAGRCVTLSQSVLGTATANQNGNGNGNPAKPKLETRIYTTRPTPVQ